MRIVALVGLALAFGVVAGGAGASALFGPEGEFKSFLGKLEYDPSRACTKPYRPYSKDEYAQREYIVSAKEYLQCMQRTAEADAKYANNVVADGLQQASDDFVKEVERGY